jgi:molecular chaperone GrpE
MDDKKQEDIIKELEERNAELENNWKRALADYRNLQKRTEEERVAFAEFANSALIRQLLPIVDNLEMLDKHVKDPGLTMILKEFKNILEQEGATQIEAFEKDYDPLTMEAVETVTGPKNKVVEVISNGYLFKNKLIKPSRVKVGSGEEN